MINTKDVNQHCSGNAVIPVIVIVVIVALVGSFLFFGAMPMPAGGPAPAPVAAGGTVTGTEPLDKIVKKEVSAGQSAERKMVAKIELPTPTFTGTPKDIPPHVKIDKKAYGKARGPFMVPAGSEVISRDKPVTASDEPLVGDLEQITDGDKEGQDSSWIEFDSGKQYVTIDLEKEAHLDAIVFWHYHKEPRFYYDVIVEVADDAEFTQNVRVLFNNDYDNSYGKGEGKDYEYVEAKDGRLVDPKGTKARYVRLHSRGSTADDLNHYTEVEVWGRAVK